MKKEKGQFFKDVYEVVKLVPYGRVTSYGAIARYLGASGSARMVGWALNGAGKYPSVPAHRVVNSKGILSGRAHFGSSDEMKNQLEAEGVKVKGDKITNFAECFWDPGTELL
ncbi:MGMT family protein [Fulvivirgaceae bacterium BMA12]|uniref:MGMT family protein n=1 Tax=Agaribacillus aureus TaxID=3051825 RepID=A0ABT8L9H4_9BACT|nr:MGMT family protein [Fulvivirgaceae bacterium BMA12]